MPTPTPRLLLSPSLSHFVCADGSVAVTAPFGAAGGCPSHPTCSSSSLPFLLFHHCVTRCVRGASVCWGEEDACVTQPHRLPFANCRLVVAALCWWLREGGGCHIHTLRMCVCFSSLSAPCCTVLLVADAAANIQPPPPTPRLSWRRGLTASPPSPLSL